MTEMTSEEIDEAMDKGENLCDLYEHQTLTISQVDRAIAMGEDFYLYKYQTITPSQINREIERGENVRYLYMFQMLTPLQIDKAIDKGECLDYLYNYRTLTSTQIDRAIDKVEALDVLCDSDLYNLEVLCTYQKLTSAQIDRVMDKEECLKVLYTYQNLSHAQIDRAMGIIDLNDSNKWQELTPSQIERIMDRIDALDFLYRHQKLTPLQIERAISRGSFFHSLYTYQDIDSPQIDMAIARGKELDYLYECQKITPSQIDKAIKKGEYLDVLFSYQTPSLDQIQYAIDNDIALEFLYTSPLTSEKQKRDILKKLNISVPEEILELAVWRNVLPTNIVEAVGILNESIANKIDRAPIDDLVGVYPVATPLNLIKLKVADKGYHVKEGDFDYAYYIDKSGREKKTKIGRILSENPKLMADYGEAKPSLKIVYEETKTLTPLSENLEIVISNNPIDVAGKSTGKGWTSCETISPKAQWGWPPNCGWCDDVKANNLVAYMRRVGETEWIGRNIIRWCIREDDNRPDAFIEKYYGNIDDPNFPLYQWIMRHNLKKIVRDRGYSGMLGDTLCKTPYNFSGWVDALHYGRYDVGPIKYHLGERGKEIEEKEEKEMVYHPKLI